MARPVRGSPPRQRFSRPGIARRGVLGLVTMMETMHALIVFLGTSCRRGAAAGLLALFVSSSAGRVAAQTVDAPGTGVNVAREAEALVVSLRGIGPAGTTHLLRIHSDRNATIP